MGRWTFKRLEGVTKVLIIYSVLTYTFFVITDFHILFSYTYPQSHLHIGALSLSLCASRHLEVVSIP